MVDIIIAGRQQGTAGLLQVGGNATERFLPTPGAEVVHEVLQERIATTVVVTTTVPAAAEATTLIATAAGVEAGACLVVPSHPFPQATAEAIVRTSLGRIPGLVVDRIRDRDLLCHNLLYKRRKRRWMQKSKNQRRTTK